MKKYSHEQLSRILSEHSDNALVRHVHRYGGNINQVALNSPFTYLCTPVADEDDIKFYADSTNWFNKNYKRSWSVDEFIKELTDKEFI